MTLPKFAPEPIRTQLEVEDAGEIWKPDWKCFCCQDTGFVTPAMAEKVILGYKDGIHKRAACYRCDAGDYFQMDDRFDQRFTNTICTELHKLNQQDWRESVMRQFEYAKLRKAEMDALEALKTMPGSRGRTPNDDREIDIKQQEFEKPPLEQAIGKQQIVNLLQDG